MELQLALTRANIPLSITSGIRFFEQAHIKDVLALIRLLSNNSDELAFLRFMQLLPGIGDKKAHKIWLTLQKNCNLLNNNTQEKVLKLIPAESIDIWKSLCEAMKNNLTVSDNTTSYAKMMEDFLNIFYNTYLLENYEDNEKRTEDIYELISFITRFDSISAFLQEVTLISNVDAETDPFEKNGGTVKLSTIHQAKGLEWKVVFIIWLVEGCFPSGKALLETETEEERRLFYVATTRAKDMLFMCVPKCRMSFKGSIQYYSPSRFIRELPSSSVEVVSVI